jgi:hypothetical protein
MSARKVRQALVAAVSAVLVAGAAGCTQTAKPGSGAVSRNSPQPTAAGGTGTPVTSGQPPPCALPTLPTVPVAPTTVTTIAQAYYCVFAHYFAGPVLDDRVLLAGAFAGFTQELDRLARRQPRGAAG